MSAVRGHIRMQMNSKMFHSRRILSKQKLRYMAHGD